MKRFLFLLLAIIFLLTIQIQTGVLGNQTVASGADPDTAATAASAASAASAGTAGTAGTAPSVAMVVSSTSSKAKDPTKSTKPVKSGVLALGDMGHGSFVFFLTNILVHLFYNN